MRSGFTVNAHMERTHSLLVPKVVHTGATLSHVHSYIRDITAEKRLVSIYLPAVNGFLFTLADRAAWALASADGARTACNMARASAINVRPLPAI